MRESDLVLRYNISALVIAILREDINIPEQAFAVVAENEYSLTDNDTRYMIALKNNGMSYKEIGFIYGMSESGVYYRIKKI